VTLAAGSNAIDAAINTQTNTLYIANSGSNTVSAFNLSSLAVTATIPVGASPRAITINESTNALYTFNADGSVSALDANQNNLVSNFPVDATAGGLLGLNPRAITYSRRSGKIYAINGFNQIDVVDPRSPRVLTTIPDVDASNVAINQGTNMVYVSQYSSGAVWVIDGATDKVVDVIRDVGQEAQPAGCYRLPGGPNSCLEMSSGLTKLAIDETLDRVYVLGEYDGRIVTIDGKTDQVIGKRFINPGDYGLAVDPRAHTVFADNFMTPALWILDGQTGQIGDVVNFNSRVCDTANSSCFDQSDLKSVTVNPATGSIYVLDQGDLNPKGTSLLYLVKPTLAP
jgi:YVTN family beta-propeller protein